MQRSAFICIAIALLMLTACADEGVGDPCIPEKIPCSEINGKTVCGYTSTESYLESSSVQCRSRICIVHQLEGVNAKNPADPTKVQTAANPTAPCTDGTCVTEQQLDQSVFCTCKCGGPKTSLEFCKCPGGFTCAQIIQEGLGGVGVQGSYCVRTEPATTAP
jgi:hypothetical protein